jgi:N-acetylneuraminic acid mutarotase
LAAPVRYPAVAVVNNAVYLFGGVTTAQGTDTTDIQRYDPATNTTQIVGQLPAPLSHATAVPLGDSVYLLGGFVNNAISTQVLRVQLPTATVTPVGALPTPLSDAAAAVVNGVGYLVGGQGSTSAPVTTVLALTLTH